MSQLPAGVHDGIPMAEYLALPYLSSGRLHTLLQYSPFHARYMPSDGPSETSEMGVAIHDALLEDVDRIASIDADDWRKKEAKEARDLARKEGRIPMLSRNVQQVKDAVASAKEYISRTEFAGIFGRGKPEQTVIWQDDQLLCKARPDWLTDERDVILHIKTTAGSAEPSSWIRNQLTSCGYDVAAVFYERGFSSIYQAVPRQSVFLVIEQTAPFGCSLVALSPAMQELATRKVSRALATWQECERTKKYPCYPTQIAYAEPKPWDVAAEEEIDLNGAYDALQAKEGLQP